MISQRVLDKLLYEPFAVVGRKFDATRTTVASSKRRRVAISLRALTTSRVTQATARLTTSSSRSVAAAEVTSLGR